MQRRSLIYIFLLSPVLIKACEVEVPSRVPSLKKLCLTIVKRTYKDKGHQLKDYEQALRDIAGLEKDHDNFAEWIEILNFVRSPDLEGAIDHIAQKQIFDQRNKQNSMPIEAGQVLKWVQHINELQQMSETISSKIWTRRNQQYSITSAFS